MPNEVKLLPCEVVSKAEVAIQLIADGSFYEDYDRSTEALGDLRALLALARPTIVTDEVVERPDVVKAPWAIFMRIDTMPKSNKNMGLDVWTIKTLQLVRETIDLAAMPAIVGGE